MILLRRRPGGSGRARQPAPAKPPAPANGRESAEGSRPHHDHAHAGGRAPPGHRDGGAGGERRSRRSGRSAARCWCRPAGACRSRRPWPGVSTRSTACALASGLGRPAAAGGPAPDAAVGAAARSPRDVRSGSGGGEGPVRRGPDPARPREADAEGPGRQPARPRAGAAGVPAGEGVVRRRARAARSRGHAGRSTPTSASRSAPPFDGTVGQLLVAPGQVVAAGATLFELENLNTLWVRVPVYVGDMSAFGGVRRGRRRVARRQRRRTGAGRPDGSPGRPPPTRRPRRPTLFFEVANGDRAFRPGERVSVVLSSAGEAPGLAVPASAIAYDYHGGAWIYVKTAPGTLPAPARGGGPHGRHERRARPGRGSLARRW